LANSLVQSLGFNATKVDSLTVTALDGTSKQVSFTIHGTNDAPSAPIDNNAADNHVSAHAANGTSVGITAFATDPDTGDTITYQLASNPNNLFAINANTGVVTVATRRTSMPGRIRLACARSTITIWLGLPARSL